METPQNHPNLLPKIAAGALLASSAALGVNAYTSHQEAQEAGFRVDQVEHENEAKTSAALGALALGVGAIAASEAVSGNSVTVRQSRRKES